MSNSHILKQDKNSHQYRLHFFNLDGILLSTTEFSDERDKLIHLCDTINHQMKPKLIRASIETMSTGFAQVR
jgi:hypothetical protein